MKFILVLTMCSFAITPSASKAMTVHLSKLNFLSSETAGHELTQVDWDSTKQKAKEKAKKALKATKNGLKTGVKGQIIKRLIKPKTACAPTSQEAIDNC